MSPMRSHTVREVLPPAAPAPVHPLTREQCDRCGVRAYVMVLTKDGPLTWCAHHFRGHATAIAALGATVTTDLRHELTST